MKRDMNIIRKVLLAVEEQYAKPKRDDSDMFSAFAGMPYEELKVDGIDSEIVSSYHNMLVESGLLQGGSGAYLFVSDLTWEGRDFLEEIRNDIMWKKISAIIKKRNLPFTVNVIRSISTTLIEAEIKSEFDQTGADGGNK